MHHAYPRECPFPHVIGATNRISPTEWMDAMDMDMLVKFEEQDLMTPEAKAEALPWSMAEELVAGHMALEASPASPWRYLKLVAAVLVLASLVAPMAQHAKAAPTSHSSLEKYVV